MVDGGLILNYPIHTFDALDDNLQYKPNMNTLGFRIDSDEQIESDQSAHSLAEIPVLNLKNYFRAFYNLVIEKNKSIFTNSSRLAKNRFYFNKKHWTKSKTIKQAGKRTSTSKRTRRFATIFTITS